MYKLIIFLVWMTFILGCKEPTYTQIVDQTSTVLGIVIDSQSQPIDSVLVGWKVHNYPDSILFIDGEIIRDSIKYNYNVEYIQRTDSSGNFDFNVFLAPMPPAPYEDMFACKKGYKVWRFDSDKDQVEIINQFKHKITITMQKL